MTKLFEKHSVKIRRATTKYKHTHTPFVEDFSKELEKLLFKPMDAQELQNPKKVSKIWVKNLDPSVKSLNNTVSSTVGIKPKDAIKLETVPLNKRYPEEILLPKDGLYIYLNNLANNMETKKDEQQTLFGVKKNVSIRSNCTRTRQSCPVLFAGQTR